MDGLQYLLVIDLKHIVSVCFIAFQFLVFPFEIFHNFHQCPKMNSSIIYFTFVSTKNKLLLKLTSATNLCNLLRE